MRQQSQHNYKRAAIIGVSTTFHPSSSSRTCTCEKSNAMSLSSGSLCVCLYVFSTLIYSRAWFTVVHAISYVSLFYKTYKRSKEKCRAAACNNVMLPVLYTKYFYYSYIYLNDSRVVVLHLMQQPTYSSSAATFLFFFVDIVVIYGVSTIIIMMMMKKEEEKTTQKQ